MPSLCDSYLRDVARFLPRTQVEELRAASRHANAVIQATTDAEKPRYRHTSLSISVVGVSMPYSE